jgi:hypothetical protein
VEVENACVWRGRLTQVTQACGTSISISGSSMFRVNNYKAIFDLLLCCSAPFSGYSPVGFVPL